MVLSSLLGRANRCSEGCSLWSGVGGTGDESLKTRAPWHKKVWEPLVLVVSKGVCKVQSPRGFSPSEVCPRGYLSFRAFHVFQAKDSDDDDDVTVGVDRDRFMDEFFEQVRNPV